MSDAALTENLSQHRDETWIANVIVRAAVSKFAVETLDRDDWTSRDPRVAQDFAAHFEERIAPVLARAQYDKLVTLQSAVDAAVLGETPPQHRYAALRAELDLVTAFLDAYFAQVDRQATDAGRAFDQANASLALKRYLETGATPSNT